MDFAKGEILLLDKPYRWTSFALVNKVRWVISHNCHIPKIKVGHAGTLDPLATGLMILCTGKKTKEIDSFSKLEKEYEAVMQLGCFTPSFDLETDFEEQLPTSHITRDMIENVAKTFIGEHLQVPPVFSAIKINGKRAYAFARDGINLQLEQKHVSIFELDILGYDKQNEQVSFKTRCSKGTYIRAIVRDFAKALRTGAHLIQLRRTKIGRFTIKDAYTIEDFVETLKKLQTTNQ